MTVLTCEPDLQRKHGQRLTTLPCWNLSLLDVTLLSAVSRDGKLPWTPHLYFMLRKRPLNFYFIRLSLASGKWPNLFLNNREEVYFLNPACWCCSLVGKKVCLVEWLFVLKQNNNQWCCWSDDGHYLLMSTLKAKVKPPGVQEEGKVCISIPAYLLTGWPVWYPSFIHWVYPRPPDYG